MGALGDVSITFVGGGTMAEALIRGLLSKGLATGSQITVSDPLQERRAHLSEQLGIRTCCSNVEAVAGAEIVVLAIKPQALGEVLEELADQIDSRVLLLTIVAGAKIDTIRSALGTGAIVRIMPNTPGQIGEGISVWTATGQVSPPQMEQAREIVGALGEQVHVEDEEYLDMATALSGSGPAYVFYFAEALIDAGVHLGFSRAVARKLVLQTVRGSAAFAQKTGLHPAVLRNMVTSPGGTTAAGLYQLDKGGLRAAVSRAVWAAYQKARYLGGLASE
ncbi:MAG: pyrroline-5-carboxylate reductase [Anaerolineales bacterium]|nr:MAG: pyrroline-5-carboxylate reductase [Anaerolineales bacterium]